MLEALGQGGRLAAGFGIGAQVGEVAGFLGVQLLQREGLAQGGRRVA
jgi:hypothetical protein